MSTTYSIDGFISYSHSDNDPLVNSSKGWVTEFHELLTKLMAQRLGSAPVIYRDSKINGNASIRSTIYAKIEDTAVMICICTPRSIKESDWCKGEREEFVRVNEDRGGIYVNDLCRMVKVIKTPVDLADLPPYLQSTPGYDFYMIDPATGRTRAFDPAFGTEYGQLFNLKVNDLSEDLINILKIMPPPDGPGHATLPIVPQASGPTIYLAETGPETKNQRDQLARELRVRGYNIVPKAPLSFERKLQETQIREMVRDAVGAIHILGCRNAHGAGDSYASVEETQFHLVNEHFQLHPGKQIVWVPPEMQLLADNDRRSGLLRQARDLQDGSETLEIFECSKGDLVDILFEENYLEWKPKPKPPVPSFVNKSRRGLVYVMLTKQDRPAADPLIKALTQQGLKVILPAFDGEENQLREDQEQNLQACNGFLIYYGSGNDLWLNSKVRGVYRVWGMGRERDFEAAAIALGPPDNQRKTGLTSPWEILDLQSGFKPEIIAPFVQKFNFQDPAA